MHSPPDHDALLDSVANLLAGLRSRLLPAMLVVPFDCEDAELHALMRLQGIASVVARNPVIDTSMQGRIEHNGEWTYPAGAARSVLYLGWRRAIRPRRLFEAMRAGMSHITALDVGGRWHTLRIPVWYLKYLQSRLQQYRYQYPFVYPRPKPCERRAMLDPRRGDRLARMLEEIHTDVEPLPRRNKVLLVTYGLWAGGAERQLMNTALGLKAAGIDVEVLSINTEAQGAEFYRSRIEIQVPVHDLSYLPSKLLRESSGTLNTYFHSIPSTALKGLYSLLPLDFIDDMVSMAAVIRLIRPGVVHLWQDYTNLVGGMAAVVAGVPRVIMAGRNLAPCNFAYHTTYMRFAYGALLQMSGVSLINNSHSGAASYCKWLDMPQERVAVVHNGIDANTFAHDEDRGRSFREQWKIPQDSPLVGGILRFSEEKDPFLWLQVASKVRERIPGARFFLAGDGKLCQQVGARIQELGLADCLVQPGVVQDIDAAYSAMDVLLLASAKEGLPNVLIEAQMAACPVVATDVGGVAETIDDGNTGWVVRQREADLLADRVCQVLQDPEWRKQARHLGPIHANREFGLARMMSDTLAVYDLETA